MRPLIVNLLCFLAVGCDGGAHRSALSVTQVDATKYVAVNGARDGEPALPPPNSHSRPVEPNKRVLIISVDGLRPDLALRAYMPRLRGLCECGSYTFWGETTPEAYTLPCHVSMLTGAPADKHGVTWNEYIEESYSNVPTLFDLAKQAGYSTALAAGKMKFNVLARPGSIDHLYLPPDEPVSDQEIVARGVEILRQHQPRVLFVHLAGVDTAGHAFGWGSPQQISVIESADRAVGVLLDALASLGLNESTLVILTADHGGAGKGHDAGNPRSHFIPWIIAGPGIRHNADLTAEDHSVHIEDTFATACGFLGLDPGGDCIGRSLAPLVANRSEKQTVIAQPLGPREPQ